MKKSKSMSNHYQKIFCIFQFYSWRVSFVSSIVVVCYVVYRQCPLTHTNKSIALYCPPYPLLYTLGEIYVFTGTVNNEKHLLGVMFFIVPDQG